MPLSRHLILGAVWQIRRFALRCKIPFQPDPVPPDSHSKGIRGIKGGIFDSLELGLTPGGQLYTGLSLITVFFFGDLSNLLVHQEDSL